MPYVVGLVLSLGVALFARFAGFDRDRVFYPTVLIVIASNYVLFAAMSGSVHTVLVESIVMTVFVIAAVVGFKTTAWTVVGALAGHGVFDALHGHVIENSGVPIWWPAFCLAYDLGAAGVLAWLIRRQPGSGVPVSAPLTLLNPEDKLATAHCLLPTAYQELPSRLH